MVVVVEAQNLLSSIANVASYANCDHMRRHKNSNYVAHRDTMQFFFMPPEDTKVIDVSIHQTNTISTSECLAHNKNGSLPESVLLFLYWLKNTTISGPVIFLILTELKKHQSTWRRVWFLLSITFSSLIVWWCLTLS